MKRASPGRITSQCLLVVGMLIATAFAQDHPAHAEDHSFLTIMTRNMDEGTDFGFFSEAVGDQALLQVALLETFCEVVASNPELRAAQIADEIAAAQPDLVSLQAVSKWQSSLLFCPGAAIGPPTTIDAETALLDRLAVDGVSYHVVSQLDELSSASIPGLPLSFLDRDVLLARDDGQLSIANVQAQHFSTLLTVSLLPGLNFTILHGWISADVTVRGRTVRVIATQLQSPSDKVGRTAGEPVQEAQAEELVTGPAATSLPVVIAGDLNTGPGTDPNVMLSYNLLTQNAGFTDTWTATRPDDPGFTDFFYTEDPPTPSTPSIRIDLILVRGAPVPSAPKDYLVGTEVPHPSDHAGVVAKVTIP